MTPPDAHDPTPEPREPACAVVEHGGEGAETVAGEPEDVRTEQNQSR